MNSAQHKFSLVLESVYGTTPATPAFKIKNITGTTLGLTKGKVESATINPNRQVVDVRHGNRQVGGDISAELAYGGHDDLLEAALCGTWTSDVLNPGITRRSFSALRQFTDGGSGTKPFHLFKGVEVNTFNISVQPEKIVSVSFGCIGREVTYSETQPTGSTYTDPVANKGFDSFSGSILVDGVPVSSVTELSLVVENGIEPRWVVFSDLTNRPKAGKCRVTGSLTLYFENSDFLVAFNGAVKRNLEFTITDLDGNDYLFQMPSILGNGGQPDVESEADITITFPFSCIYETGAGIPDALRITRTAA